MIFAFWSASSSIVTALSGTTGRDIVTNALREIRVLNATDPASGEDAAYGLHKLNVLLDGWNADRRAVYVDEFTTFTLTPALSPHTIGPTGTFNVVQRPETISGMNLVVAGVRYRITHDRDKEWWLAKSLHGQTSPIPTDCYYEPAWPVGKLFFWPVPTVASGVEILARVLLGTLLLTTTLSLPPGYEDAITLSLAEALAGPFKADLELLQVLAPAARKARARVFDNHDETPRLVTQDAGMPGGSGGSSFNYLTREM